MEDIKLAFETIIVGLMAIPWLLILLHIFFYLLKFINLFNKFPDFIKGEEKSYALLGTFILGIAFCLGSVIFPLADELFNKNRHILGIQIKKDADIRTDVLAELYFQKKFYQLSAEDFKGLENLFENGNGIKEDIRKGAIELAALNEDEENGNFLPFKEKQKLYYKRLNDTFHAIYNFQKFSNYNSAKGYEVLKPLNSRIVILRGAVFNGLFLLGALILFMFAALFEWILKSFNFNKDRGLFNIYPLNSFKVPAYIKNLKSANERIIYGENLFWIPFIFLIILIALVWLFCVFGAQAVTDAEQEYDKHVVGLFYGQKANGGLKKTE